MNVPPGYGTRRYITPRMCNVDPLRPSCSPTGAPHSGIHFIKLYGAYVRREERRWGSPASAALDLRRRTRFSKLYRVFHAESGASYTSRPLSRDLRREEAPFDLGAKAHAGLWGLGTWKRHVKRTDPTHKHCRMYPRFQHEKPSSSLVGRFASYNDRGLL